METVFLKVLNMSITASYVIAAVILIRMLLRKAPKKYAYLLWSVVGFRLCCPVSFQSAFSIFGLKLFDMTAAQRAGGETLRYVPDNIGMMAQPQVSVGISSVNTAISSSLPAASPMTSANPMQIWIAAATLIWCAGMAAFVFYSMIAWFLLYRRMANAILLEGNVYQSDRVRSPFILGFFRPRIYIPFGLDKKSMHYVLMHERYHLKRRDHMIRLLAFLLLVVHWFNPLCWLAFSLMGRDMEMSCDEKVLSSEENIRKAYSMTLLSFAANRRFPQPNPLSFAETGVKRRIKNVLKWQSPKMGVTAAAIVLCVIVMVACAANPVSETEKDQSDIAAAEISAPTDGKREGDLLDSAIVTAILEHNKSGRSEGVPFVSYVPLMTEASGPSQLGQADMVTVYAMVLYQEYKLTAGAIEDVGGSHIPTALTFEVSQEGEYALTEYWEPRDGSYYVPDIREKFPKNVYSRALDTQKYILQQIQTCYAQAVEYFCVDTNQVLDQLMDTILSSPEGASNIQAYIEAHPIEYRELTYYGAYTQEYITEQLQSGEQTGLRAKLMHAVWDELNLSE